MAIIIIADSSDTPVPESKVAPQPVVPPIQKKPEPQYRTHRKPKLELNPTPELNEMYDELSSLISEYKAAKHDNAKSYLIDRIFNTTTRARGSQTIRQWLMNELKHVPDQDKESEAQLLLWKALERIEPTGNLLGYLDRMIGTNERKLLDKEHDIGTTRSNEAAGYLTPYLKYILNPESPEQGSKPVSPDLLEKVQTGEMKPGQAALEQNWRDDYNNYTDPATGKTRFQIAKERFDKEFSDAVAKTGQRPELWLPINNENKFRSAIQLLKQMSPEYWNEVRNQKSPYWYSYEMIKPRGINPASLDKMWQGVSSPTLSLDKPSGEEGQLEDLGSGVSSDEYKRMKSRIDTSDFSPQQKKTIIEEAPYEYLNLFEDPEDRQKIEERLPLIQPYSPARDAAGNPVMEGNKPRMDRNPEFQKAVDGMVEQLYGPSSAPRKILDERGRPMGTPQAEQRTKEALYMIGQFYANSLNDKRDEQSRLKDLEQQLGPLMQKPLLLRHYEGPPLSPNQQIAFALREVMLDMMENLIDDNKYTMLSQQMGQRAVAELKRWLRTSSLLLISRIIARG